MTVTVVIDDVSGDVCVATQGAEFYQLSSNEDGMVSTPLVLTDLAAEQQVTVYYDGMADDCYLANLILTSE
jgi:hypothetical protein